MVHSWFVSGVHTSGPGLVWFVDKYEAHGLLGQTLDFNDHLVDIDFALS